MRGSVAVAAGLLAAGMALAAPYEARPAEAPRTLVPLPRIARRPSLSPLFTEEQSLARARVGAKYGMLLRQLYVPDDLKTYTDFSDYGIYPATSYAGYEDLPGGYWVYVYPYWYLWRDLNSERKPVSPYSAGQAVGPPDTAKTGDAPTAWESRSPDGQEEWLLLEYEEPLLPVTLRIYETRNPGALKRITCFRLDGEEEEIWAGADPTPPAAAGRVSEIRCGVDFRTNRIKLYLDSRRVPGRNAVDAVGVIDGRGMTRWAVAAEASSARE